MSRGNPIYWVWGTIVALVTLPWVVWRRNFGIAFPPTPVGFYIVIIAVAGFITLYNIKNNGGF